MGDTSGSERGSDEGRIFRTNDGRLIEIKFCLREDLSLGMELGSRAVLLVGVVEE